MCGLNDRLYGATYKQPHGCKPRYPWSWPLKTVTSPGLVKAQPCTHLKATLPFGVAFSKLSQVGSVEDLLPSLDTINIVKQHLSGSGGRTSVRGVNKNLRITAQGNLHIAFAKLCPCPLHQVSHARWDLGVDEHIGQAGKPHIAIETARIAEEGLAEHAQRCEQLILGVAARLS
ncbi:hypothetical protein D3C85_1383510 [compost metagenome]